MVINYNGAYIREWNSGSAQPSSDAIIGAYNTWKADYDSKEYQRTRNAPRYLSKSDDETANLIFAVLNFESHVFCSVWDAPLAIFIIIFIIMIVDFCSF